LETVHRPDGQLVSFAYDPVGRRVSKEFDGKITRYVWDGNRILHEWQTVSEDADTIKPFTWLYSGNTFTPIAKLTHEKAYSVITDHLGTPTMMVNNKGGQAVWKCKLNIYGQKRLADGGNTEEENCNFRYPGQYEDVETGLYYNRFRYYDPDMGGYTQRDPIGLSGGNPTVYGYVWSTLLEVDPWGLAQFFRSMSRSEYFDIHDNGWRGIDGTMDFKWFANDFDSAATWGQAMGHAGDKFYVVGFDIPDNIRPLQQNASLDRIGAATLFDANDLNNPDVRVESVNAVRTDPNLQRHGVCQG